MQKLFNNILVPIDFSRRSIKAAEKAVELANLYSCSITFLHVVALHPFAAVAVVEGHVTIPYAVIDNHQEIQFRLEKIIAQLVPVYGQVNIKAEVIAGSWDESIICYAMENKFDLVLIGQKSRFHGKRNMLLNPDKIAAKANIPVITIPMNRRLTKLGSVLIPVSDFLPVRKLIYGIYIAKMNNATIKLLAVQTRNNNEKSDYYLKKSYRLIKDYCDLPAEMTSIESANTAEGVTRYMTRHQVDLIILNPGTQTKLPGLFSSLLGKIIQKYTQVPVLTITPI